MISNRVGMSGVAACLIGVTALAQPVPAPSGSMPGTPTPNAPMPSAPTAGAPIGGSATPGSPTPGAPMSGAPMSGAPMSGATISGQMPMAPATAPPAFHQITASPALDMVTALKGSGQFTTLLKALDATGLTPVIQKQPNITLFAPTDAAFDGLPPGRLAMLMQPDNLGQLQAILTYHVVATRIAPAQVRGHAPGRVSTVAPGKQVLIDGSGSTLKINEATVLQAGVAASNGVIYVVDQVLTPPA